MLESRALFVEDNVRISSYSSGAHFQCLSACCASCFKASDNTKARTVTPTPDRDHVPMEVVPVNGDVAKKPKGRRRAGPGDDVTPTRALVNLSGHTAEVNIISMNDAQSLLTIVVQVFVCAWNPAQPELLASGSVNF